MTVRKASAIAGGLMLLATSTWAGELADLGAAADDRLAQGRHLEALTLLSDAEASVWRKSPLLFRRTVFVASDPRGYGDYEPRSGTFKRNEQIVIYAEPVGYGYRKEGEMAVIDLVLDFTVTNAEGVVLGGQKAFANPRLKSRAELREFFLRIAYDFSGISAGNYTVSTTVNDKASGKSASFDMPFTLTE